MELEGGQIVQIVLLLLKPNPLPIFVLWDIAEQHSAKAVLSFPQRVVYGHLFHQKHLEKNR
jgi:hypothetical protein